jgi:tetratricopeptide (TPR) repeat protein
MRPSTIAPPATGRPSTIAPPASGAPVRPTPSPTASPPVRPSRPLTVGPAPAAGARPRGATATPPAGNAPIDPADFAAAIAAANEGYQRGLAALKRNDLQTAVTELQQASLVSKDHDHIAAFVWAQFCLAPDKQAIAKTVRNTLSQTIMKSDKPELARFYLGRVERMLGRDKEALQMFKSVVELDPRHAEANAEIRALEARIAAETKGGLFQRKR